MKLEFCPQCAGIDVKKEPNGLSRCKRCGFQGEMRYGAMNEINALKTRLTAGASSEISQPSGQSAQEQKKHDYNNPLKEKLKGLKGKKNSESEFL